MTSGDFTVETRLARVEQRVSDLDARVMAMVPLTASVVQLTERVDVLRRDLRGYADAMKTLNMQVEQREKEKEERDDEIRKERRDARRAMWSLTVLILCALIGAAAVLLSQSGVH